MDMDDINLIRNRSSDWAERAYNRGVYSYSDFLSLAEQNELKKMKFPVNITLYGGYPMAERCIAVFGSESDFGYAASPPVTFIKIEPLAQKFSDALTHRDFLGSLMGLGIKRETLGDIVIKENSAYLICLESMAKYITDNLFKVKHTSVSCTLCDDVPQDITPELKYNELIVASERIDVLISAVFNLSRTESQKRIEDETVFCNSLLITSTSAVLKEGSVISVRGKGRFIYDGVLRSTKKGRNVIAVRVY